jgi:DNA replicative helicase MCM subunit Mcm2 (Cdc46/Mcm family)
MGCTSNREEVLEANNWEYDKDKNWEGNVDEAKVQEEMDASSKKDPKDINVVYRGDRLKVRKPGDHW